MDSTVVRGQEGMDRANDVLVERLVVDDRPDAALGFQDDQEQVRQMVLWRTDARSRGSSPFARAATPTMAPPTNHAHYSVAASNYVILIQTTPSYDPGCPR